jgi:hypothetical protein
MACWERRTPLGCAAKRVVFAIGRRSIASGNHPAHLRSLGQTIESSSIARRENPERHRLVDSLTFPLTEGRPDALGQIIAISRRFRNRSFKTIAERTDNG